MTLNRASRALLLVAVLAVIGASYWRFTSQEVRQPRPEPPSASARHEVAPPGIAATPRARLLVAEKQVRGTSDSACAMSRSPAESGVDPEDPAAQAAFMRRPDIASLVKGMRHIDGGLRASADPFANAVALWLDLPRTDDDSEGLPAGETQRRLAMMAASTTDPRLYALAFRTCSGSAEAACQALSARRWAVLDPGNAVPWLFLLNDAEHAGDASGQQEAWFHMAASSAFEERLYTQIQPILAAADDSPDDKRAAEILSVMGIGIAAGQPVGFGTVLKGCRGPALADANRAQLCTKVADLLFDHSDTSIARQLGASMTRRQTGDDRRNDQFAEEMKFWTAHDPVQPKGCAELNRQLDFLSSLATHGSHGTYAAMTRGAPSP